MSRLSMLVRTSIMLIVVLFVIFLLVPSYLAVSYYLVLVTARLLGCHDTPARSMAPKHRFTIVIPAHDEAEEIALAVRSCFEVDYPAERRRVVVVADNCHDATAHSAQLAGADVLVRSAPDDPGKGPALAWAFDQLLASDTDAFFILDADCRVDRDTLRIADAALQSGDRVLQTNHRVTNADVSPISYAAGVGRTLEYDLFFAPKSRLGLSVLLVGTGMVFHRSVLEAWPWTSRSCAEDTEYTIKLTRERQSIRFLSNAHIQCLGVTSVEAMHVQRTRWAKGNIDAGHGRAMRLMVDGLRHGNLRLVDLGWTLLLVSRPLILIHLLCVLGAAALISVFQPTPTTQWLTWMSLALIPLYVLYFVSGVLAMGLSAKRLRHLARAPAVVWQLGKIAVAALLGMGTSSWVRTPRQ